MNQYRFVALDSWRGIAALAVVAFHFRRTAGLDGQAVFDGMFLFVDFFFVLSGFVIFSKYGEKLRVGYSARRFLFLRLGRIYPLHCVILAVFVLLDVAFVYPVTGEWFPGPRKSWDTVIANFLLVHSLDIFPFLTWNQPSWSISVEFFAYVMFAMAVPLAGRNFGILCLAVVVIAPAVLFNFNNGKNLDATAHFGIVRCLFGFCSGVLAYKLYSRYSKIELLLRAKWIQASVAEIGMIILTVVFITTSGVSPLSLVAPLVFGLVVIVFAHEAGICSWVLRCRPLVFLGAISYSVYMTHMLVLSWWLSAVRAVTFKLGGRDLFDSVVQFARTYTFMEGRNYSGLALMLGLVILVSTVTYSLIEMPFRKYSRHSTWFSAPAMD